MSATAAESEARQISARARIASWLNKSFGLSIAEDDPELLKQARTFGSDGGDDVVDGHQHLDDRLDARCDELESEYRRQRQSDEQRAEQMTDPADGDRATQRRSQT